MPFYFKMIEKFTSPILWYALVFFYFFTISFASVTYMRIVKFYFKENI